MNKFNESRKRSFLKVLTWRAFQVLLQTAIGYWLTGSLLAGISLASLGIIVNSAVFYINERVWNMTDVMRTQTDGAFTESKWRPVAKNMTMKLALLIALWVTAMLITQQNTTSMHYAGIISAINFVLYYCHERLWNLTEWERTLDEQSVPTIA